MKHGNPLLVSLLLGLNTFSAHATQTVVHLYAPVENNVYGAGSVETLSDNREFGRLIFDDSLDNPVATFLPLWSAFNTSIGSKTVYSQLIDLNNKINLSASGKIGSTSLPFSPGAPYSVVITNTVGIASPQTFLPGDLSSDVKLGTISGWADFFGYTANLSNSSRQINLNFGNGSQESGNFGMLYGATIFERQVNAGQSASSAWFPQFVANNGNLGFLAGDGSLNITTINGLNAGEALNHRGGFFDPERAEGYTFETEDPGLTFETVMIPHAYGDGLFSLLSYNETSGQFEDTGHTLKSGEWFDLTTLVGTGVTKFRLMGIESYVDPSDPMGFVTGLTFLGNGEKFTMSAVTAVPLPAAIWLFSSGLLGMLGLKRRNFFA